MCLLTQRVQSLPVALGIFLKSFMITLVSPLLFLIVSRRIHKLLPCTIVSVFFVSLRPPVRICFLGLLKSVLSSGIFPIFPHPLSLRIIGICFLKPFCCSLILLFLFLLISYRICCYVCASYPSCLSIPSFPFVIAHFWGSWHFAGSASGMVCCDASI